MRAVQLFVSLVGVAGAVVLVPIVHASPVATYGGAQPRLLALEAGAALALVMVAGLSRPSLGAVLVAAVGAMWLLPETAGAVGVPLGWRTGLDALGPIMAVTLLVALGLRSGVTRRMRGLLLVATTGAVLAATARLVLVDPFFERSCWRMCEHNPFLVIGTRTGGTVALAGLLALALGTAGSAAACLPEALRGRGSATDADAAGWIVLGGLIGSLLVTSGLIPVSGDDDLPIVLFAVIQAAAIAWLTVVAWQGWRRWRLESRLAHLVDLMGSTSDPEALVNSLRRAARDPTLRLAYWAPARQMYVDPAGRPATDAAPAPHQRLTAITRNGQTIAAVVHSRRVDGQRLERALSPALRLALENAQLRAASLAELSELTTSRTRVVERAQLERRRLERNLHDGAQQRVVSLALLVRLLTGHASPIDPSAAARAELLTRTLVEELRRVARGIYPAVLADAGLLGGVIDLAERSEDVPVVVGDFPEARFAGTIETTAYLLVRDGIADARQSGATCVSVAGTNADGILRVTVEDDAATTPYVVATDLADQVGALGGTLTMDGAPGRRRVEVVLPCVS